MTHINNGVTSRLNFNEDFQVKVEPSGTSLRGRESLQEFMKNQGYGKLKDLLREAGLGQGFWKAHLFRASLIGKSANHTPVWGGFQVEDYYVRMRFHPPGTGYAYLLRLIVDKSHPEPPQDVVTRLQKANARLYGEAAKEPAGAAKEPTNDDVDRALDAIQRLDAAPACNYLNWGDFVAAVADEVGPNQDVEFWELVLIKAQQDGLAYRKGNRVYEIQPVEELVESAPTSTVTVESVTQTEPAVPTTELVPAHPQPEAQPITVNPTTAAVSPFASLLQAGGLAEALIVLQDFGTKHAQIQVEVASADAEVQAALQRLRKAEARLAECQRQEDELKRQATAATQALNGDLLIQIGQSLKEFQKQ